MKPRMRTIRGYTEHHRTSSIGWLRAAVLGANDGIVSTGSLMLGVAAASVGASAGVDASHSNILLTGIAGLVAGAMSMAAGEYVSVHSQADTENADLARESAEQKDDPVSEHSELAAIYVGRGLNSNLARQVAEQLMAHDALGAHAKDELGVGASDAGVVACNVKPTKALNRGCNRSFDTSNACDVESNK